MLRDIIIRRAWHAEFIRSVIHDWFMAAKIIMRWRRRDGPLESRRMPWIFFLGFLPRKQAPDDVEQEEELRPDRDNRRISDKHMNWLQLLKENHRAGVVVAPRMSGQTQEVHRHEDGVHADERKPEVDFADS